MYKELIIRVYSGIRKANRVGNKLTKNYYEKSKKNHEK